jgi:hypothetical protein
MKAVAVFPGKAGSVHLAELPKPNVYDVPDGRDLRDEKGERPGVSRRCQIPVGSQLERPHSVS